MTPPNRQDHQEGAALIVLVLGLTLLALAMVGALRFWGPRDDLRRATGNNANTRVAAAIDRYAAANGNLPCPDVNGEGTAEPSSSCGTVTTWGLVPWKTIGLGPQDAVDAWGRRLTYALAANSTSAPYACNVKASANSGGGLATWSSLTPVSGGTSAAYVLVNHGPNGRGAFQQNGAAIGSQLSVPTDANEAYNCPRDVGTSSVCKSVDRTRYWAGPYVAQGSNTTTWFDDTVSARTGQTYACLCVQPTISTNFNLSSGTVIATAALVSPATCDTAWTTSVGQGSNWGSATRTPTNCAGNPVVTRAGNSCSVSAALTPPGIVAASNLENAGWPSAATPKSPSFKFLASPSATGSPSSGGTSSSMPAMDELNLSNNGNGSLDSYSNGRGTTTETTGTKTLTYTDVIGIITIQSNGANLCYEADTETLGVVHQDGCYLATSDSLTITLPTSLSFSVFAMILDFKTAGSVSISELNSAGNTCDTGMTCSNPLSFPTVEAGYMIIPWQAVTETTSGGSISTFKFNTLIIQPTGTGTPKIGLFAFFAST
ncbi:hypothetical protein [Telmatospirillum siberiense]|uniref:hypothetical protein n=1 Tax=Telmatospirillum siberiense TaxID=382514 RepID=UPI0011AF43B1|nr:hypothetical protein [Telmatospirillum siberiense]